MGLEVVVRPVVFPNIRPPAPRVLAKANNPESGLAVISGGGGKFVTTSVSWSFSASHDKPHGEVKRQVDTERVYQMDDGGNINRNNFVDVERLKKVKLENESDTIRNEYATYPKPDNVEVIDSDKTLTPET